MMRAPLPHPQNPRRAEGASCRDPLRYSEGLKALLLPLVLRCERKVSEAPQWSSPGLDWSWNPTGMLLSANPMGMLSPGAPTVASIIAVLLSTTCKHPLCNQQPLSLQDECMVSALNTLQSTLSVIISPPGVYRLSGNTIGLASYLPPRRSCLQCTDLAPAI